MPCIKSLAHLTERRMKVGGARSPKTTSTGMLRLLRASELGQGFELKRVEGVDQPEPELERQVGGC